MTALMEVQRRSSMQCAIRSAIFAACGLLMLGLWNAPGRAQAQGQVGLQSGPAVAVRDGLVSVEVDDAALSELIVEIGRMAGFETVGESSLDLRVSVSITGRPIDEVVRQLARDVTYVILYGPEQPGGSPGSIKEVRFYPAPKTATANSTAARPASVGASQGFAALDAHDNQTRLQAVQSLGNQGSAEALLALSQIVAEDELPVIRAQAAVALGRSGKEAAVAALLAALEDPDLSVRVQAVLGLARLGGADTTRILGQVLIEAPDRRLRRTALRALERSDDEAALAYLETAAADSDPVMRKLAAQSLNRQEQWKPKDR